MSIARNKFAALIALPPIPDNVYVEMVDTLFATNVPITVAGWGLAIIGTIATTQTGDVPVGLLAAAGVIVAFLRLLLVGAYRRRVAQVRLDRAEAARWDHWYSIGGNTTGAVIGLFTLRAFMIDNSTIAMMASGIAFGFAAGVVARGSLRPWVAVRSMILVGVPTIIGSLLRIDVAHIGLALLLAFYFFGSLETVRFTYETTANQLVLKRQFESLARTDPLTGLLNRVSLSAEVPELLAASERGRVAVHSIDLDHFKAANDRFGHPAGDALLRLVAKRLKGLLREGDLAIRLGGDEFLLVQSEVMAREDVAALARRIVSSISAPYSIDGREIRIGASVGVAVAPVSGATVDELTARADRALYAAKRERNDFVIGSDAAGDIIANNAESCGQLRLAFIA